MYYRVYSRSSTAAHSRRFESRPRPKRAFGLQQTADAILSYSQPLLPLLLHFMRRSSQNYYTVDSRFSFQPGRGKLSKQRVTELGSDIYENFKFAHSSALKLFSGGKMSVEKNSWMHSPMETDEFSLNRDATVCTKAETVLLGESWWCSNTHWFITNQCLFAILQLFLQKLMVFVTDIKNLISKKK